MTHVVEHARLRRIGGATDVLGLILVAVALIFPSDKVEADTHAFEGACASVDNAGVCVLDEPEGKNPAVHGLVAFLRTSLTMSFTVDAVDPVTEVQICMQTTEPFAEGANVCAGSHGPHVTWQQVSNIYTVDLAAEGLNGANPLYWTLHVVAGGRTLQVLGRSGPPPPTTTSTVPVTTTSTTVPVTTTSTTVPVTTTSTVPGSTTTTLPGGTTTTAPGTTTSTVAPTTTTLVGTTTTTLPIEVGGRTLGRTGGPSYWALLFGAALMLIGVTLIVTTRLLEARP